MKKTCKIACILLLLLSSCSNENSIKSKTNSFQTNESTTIDTITTEVFKIDSGYGYNIKINGKTYIHQPMIPAISGNKAFSTYDNARKTAAFVVSKLLNNIVPPTVTKEELDSLKVI